MSIGQAVGIYAALACLTSVIALFAFIERPSNWTRDEVLAASIGIGITWPCALLCLLWIVGLGARRLIRRSYKRANR